MDFDKSLKVTVTELGGRMIQVVVDSGSALIGSGGHCDIRLGPELVAVEQLFLDVQPGGLFAEARASQPLVTVDGVPFQRGRVLEDRSFRIGKLEVKAELVTPVGLKRKKEEGVRPGLLIVAAVVLGAGVFSILANRGGDDGGDYQTAPKLFEANTATCPDVSHSAMTAVAETWLRDASGRHERSPFSPQDGVAAVGLYRKAASCLVKLDRGTEAAELRLEADALATRLEKDFHVHRVRLSRALGEEDIPAARHEVALLRGYLSQHGSEFATWLDFLDRRLGLQSKK
jgi:hypothetical protein